MSPPHYLRVMNPEIVELIERTAGEVVNLQAENYYSADYTALKKRLNGPLSKEMQTRTVQEIVKEMEGT